MEGMDELTSFYEILGRDLVADAIAWASGSPSYGSIRVEISKSFGYSWEDLERTKLSFYPPREFSQLLSQGFGELFGREELASLPGTCDIFNFELIRRSGHFSLKLLSLGCLDGPGNAFGFGIYLSDRPDPQRISQEMELGKPTKPSYPELRKLGPGRPPVLDDRLKSVRLGRGGLSLGEILEAFLSLETGGAGHFQVSSQPIFLALGPFRSYWDHFGRPFYSVPSLYLAPRDLLRSWMKARRHRAL